MTLSAGSADPTFLEGAESVRARVPSTRRPFDDSPEPKVALVAHGGTPLPDLGLGERATFVVGAEREGLPADVIAGCAAVATIPLAPDAESLNVAVSGAIALYEWRRRHG